MVTIKKTNKQTNKNEVEAPQNRFISLPDELYLHIISFLPRYIPDLIDPYPDLGITSENLITITVINNVYIEFCENYSMEYCRILRDRFFHLNEVTPQDCMFNSDSDIEHVWYTNAFNLSIKRIILNEEIKNYRFSQMRVQCEEESADEFARISIITEDDTRYAYESNGPMSPISSIDDSIHRIFCDGECDFADVKTSFTRTYLNDISGYDERILQEEIPEIFDLSIYTEYDHQPFDLENDLFKYKNYDTEMHIYGEFAISEDDYGMFPNYSPTNSPRVKLRVQAEDEDESYTSQFFSKYFLPRLNVHLAQQLETLGADYIPKLFDDIMTFVQMATQNIEGWNRFQTIYQAVRVFLKCRYNESSAKIFFDRVAPYIKGLFDDLVPQADFFEASRGFLNSYKNINESPIVVKLYKCCMFLLSMSVFDKFGVTFDKFGFTKLEEIAIKKKLYKKSDFIYVICDTLLFVLERGYQVYLTGDISCLFHSGGTYKNLYDDCRELQRQKEQLCNPEANGFTESDFRGRLDVVIEKLINIEKHSFRLDKTDIKVIRVTLNDMLMIRDDLNTKSAARSNRKAPLGLLIFGDSGIGKTSVTSMLCTYFAKHEKLPHTEEFRYTVNPAAKYWDGFVTSQHTVILDDVANEDPSLGDPKSLNVIIQVMNNQAYCPDQASLEMKGTTPFRGRLVVATTNVKNLNAYYYFSCPSAVQRRFPYIITPTVRKEYQDERGMLNSCKVPPNKPYADLWTFKVEIVKPVPVSQGKQYANIELVKDNISTTELLLWFDKAIDKFNEDQNRVQQSIKLMQETELCLCCNLPDNLCQLKPQGFIEAVHSTFLLVSMFYLYLRLISHIMYRVQSSVPYRRALLCYQFYTVMDKNVNLFQIKSNELIRNINDRDSWERIGNKMRDALKQPKVFIPLATMITLILTSYKTYKKLTPQGDVSSEVGTRPIEELNGRENVWYNNNFDLSPANFSRESSSSKSMEFTDFCTKIGENVCCSRILSFKTKKHRGGRLLALGGHIYLANNHTIPDLSEGGTLQVKYSHAVGVGSNMTFNVSENDVHRIPGKDIAFLTLRCLPPKKKITQFFQRGSSNGIFNGFYAARTKDGRFHLNPVKKIKKLPERITKNTLYEIESKNNLWGGISEVATIDGDCGTPLIINSSYGYSIVGIHFLANELHPGEIYSTNIDGNFIDQVYSSLNQFNVSAGDFSNVSSKSKQRAVGDLHKKSVFRYIPEGNAHVYGSFMDFRGKSKSAVTKTPMNNLLEKESYKTNYSKPEMKSWVPWHTAAKDLVQPITSLDTNLLEQCAQSYVNDVLESVNTSKIKDMLHPLDDFTAINGAQVAYIDKINRNTSAGNPWKMSKKFFMETIPPMHGMLDPVEVDDEIMNRVDDIILRYKNNEQAHPNFCAHLKDEPVTHKKAKIGKTRVFTGAPFDWTIVVRKYLLSFTRLVQNERLAFESAPGTIAQSIEWQEMYDHIIKHGPENIVAGDYKAFDKKMSPKEILLAFDIIITFMKLSESYTEEDLQIIRCIAEDTAFALVEFNGDLIQLFGSNPSGNPLTVILNGLVNCIRMRYVYALLHPENKLSDFKDNVSLMTYGDDNIMSVSNEASWFNHTAIASKFAELDIIYTMADKEAESVPFIHIDQASFLKRTWRHDEDLGCMVAPLDHDSIEKMLMVWNRSKSVTEEAQGISVISTALREYFFYGRETYTIKLKMLKKLVKDLKWDIWIEDSTFPTFDELCENFKKSSKHCDSFEVYFPLSTF